LFPIKNVEFNFDDKNIIVTFYFYTQFEFTHKKSSGFIYPLQ